MPHGTVYLDEEGASSSEGPRSHTTASRGLSQSTIRPSGSKPRVEVFGHIRERGKSFYAARYLLAGQDNLAWGKKAKPRIKRKGGVHPQRDVVAAPRWKG